MARYVLTTAAAVAFANYQSPGRTHFKGQVVELSAAEVTALGAGSLRAVTTSNVKDQLGEAFAVANSS